MSFALVFTSCVSEGCIDNDAVNFDADADRSDGSCEFEGSVVFWYSKATSEDYVFFDALTMYFYVDETLIGSSSSSFYWDKAPDCEAVGSISFRRSMGNSKSETATYLVLDEDGFEWDKGSFRFKANSCEQIEVK